MKSLEQMSQRKGRAPPPFLLCDRSWNNKLPFKGNDLPHSPQLNGRSPQLCDLQVPVLNKHRQPKQ